MWLLNSADQSAGIIASSIEVAVDLAQGARSFARGTPRDSTAKFLPILVYLSVTTEKP